MQYCVMKYLRNYMNSYSVKIKYKNWTYKEIKLIFGFSLHYISYRKTLYLFKSFFTF